MTVIRKLPGNLNSSPSCEVIPSPQRDGGGIVASVKPVIVAKGNKVSNNSHSNNSNNSRPVSFLLESEVYQLADAAKTSRQGDRDELLIMLLFQGALRISEVLAFTPGDRVRVGDKYCLMIRHGKGDKPRVITIPGPLYMRMGNYICEHNIGPGDKFFTITRFRALQIVKEAGIKAGLEHRRLYCHLMRHSGAIARLKRTGNLESLKQHLGHSDNKMTLRYLKTMQAIESLEVESKVEFER
jgi:integrase